MFFAVVTFVIVAVVTGFDDISVLLPMFVFVIVFVITIVVFS